MQEAFLALVGKFGEVRLPLQTLIDVLCVDAESRIGFAFLVALFTLYFSARGLLDRSEVSFDSSPDFKIALRRLQKEKRLTYSAWIDWIPLLPITRHVEVLWPDLEATDLTSTYRSYTSKVDLRKGPEEARNTLQGLQDDLNRRSEEAEAEGAEASTAYRLSHFLHGKSTHAQGSILDPALRFRKGRVLFPVKEASAFWELLTSVHTTWDDPNDSATGVMLRAYPPWGQMTCAQPDSTEVYCEATLTNVMRSPEGECAHFGQWEFDGDKPKIQRMNKAGFYAKEFAVHMQEETIYNIYSYAWSLIQASQLIVIGEEKLPTRIPGRSRGKYKDAAVEAFSKFLRAFGGDTSSFGDCTDTYNDPFGVSSAISNPITREYELYQIMQLDHRQLSPAMKQYQLLLATKLCRLARKAAIYDDHFAQWGLRNKEFWIG